MWPLKARPHLASGGRYRPIWPFTCALGGGNPVEVCLFNSDFSPFSPSYQILSCGQPAATGFAWMDSLRRPHRPREPGHRPIPTLGTAPSLLPRAQNQAARPVGPTSQAWPGSRPAWTVRRTSARTVRARWAPGPASAFSASASAPRPSGGRSS